MASSLRNTLDFFDTLGVFDVIMPFLLVFTIVFAILEKTKIFGMEKIRDELYPKKGLNSIVAFAMALTFVASSKLVGVALGAIAQFVLLLLLPILFLLLVGTFHTGEEEFALSKGWQNVFYVILFVGIMLVFLGQLGWLDIAYEWALSNYNSQIFSSFVFLAVIVGGIWLVVREPQKKEKAKD